MYTSILQARKLRLGKGQDLRLRLLHMYVSQQSCAFNCCKVSDSIILSLRVGLPKFEFWVFNFSPSSKISLRVCLREFVFCLERQPCQVIAE